MMSTPSKRARSNPKYFFIVALIQNRKNTIRQFFERTISDACNRHRNDKFGQIYTVGKGVCFYNLQGIWQGNTFNGAVCKSANVELGYTMRDNNFFDPAILKRISSDNFDVGRDSILGQFRVYS